MIYIIARTLYNLFLDVYTEICVQISRLLLFLKGKSVNSHFTLGCVRSLHAAKKATHTHTKAANLQMEGVDVNDSLTQKDCTD